MQSCEAMERQNRCERLGSEIIGVSENNISNENPEELDGDLTESDEDEETMQKSSRDLA